MDASASIGRHTSSPFNLTFTKPLQGDPSKLFSASAHSTSSAFPTGTRYCHSNAGLSTTLRLPSTLLPAGSHELGYGLDWRQVYGLKHDASPSLRRSAGHSLKSALSHVWTSSTRDDMVFPTAGHFFRWSQELAGLGGDAQHIKNDIFGSIHLPIFKTLLSNPLSLTMSIHAGHLLPTSGSKSFLLDRFQMGGPSSVRGFKLNSLGPRDQDDALGGDLALEGGFSLSFPITPSTGDFVRGQFFSNFGILGSAEPSLSLADNFKDFLATPPSVSVGAGLLIRLSPSTRLELNLACPLLSPSHHSQPDRGIQLGLGIEFL